MATETPEISILDELRRGGFEFSFAATYNAYLPFYEDVVWRRLASAGCRANVLLMDGRQCAVAFSDEGSRPRLAGREYTLIPVRARGAFHPKLLMLVGRERGLLFVGSHNLTVAGYGRNRELTSRIESSGEDSAAAFGEAWRFMRAWFADQPTELLAAFDAAEGYAGWLREASTAVPPEGAHARLFGSSPEGESLWQQVRGVMPEAVRRITVVSPFFDGQLRFLKRLAEDLKPDEFVVGIEPGAVVIDHEAWRALPDVRFVDSKVLREGKGYLHAKALLVEAVDGRELLVTGSANASWQAWLAGGDERNAEAVTVVSGSKGQSLARALGLKELAKEAAALTPDDWEKIGSRDSSQPKQGDRSHPSPLVAVETESGFDVRDAVPLGAALEAAELLGDDGRGAANAVVFETEGATYKIAVPEHGLRQRTWAVVLRFADGGERFALAHHTFDVAASAQTDRQREWRRTFDSLDTGTPLLEEMLKIVERVIFDDFEARQPRPRAAAERTGGGEASGGADAEVPQQTYSVRLSEVASTLHHGRHAQFDDLSVILNAINRRLGEGLEASVSLAPSIARSEEELVGIEGEDVVTWHEVDGAALAAACRRRVSTMLRRMVGQLELAARSPERSLGAVRQTAAVLGILHRLRELERTAGWLPRDETLIRKKEEWKFFLDATRLLFRRSAPVLRRAAEAYASAGAGTPAAEPSAAAGLLLWLAWDCDLDVRSASDADDRSELRENLRGVARLLAMARDLSADEKACARASEAISRQCSFYASDGVTETWCDEHLDWLKKVSNADLSPRWERPQARPADVGDLVYPTLKPELGLRVVLQSSGTSVKVVDLDKEDELTPYSTKYVSVIRL